MKGKGEMMSEERRNGGSVTWKGGGGTHVLVLLLVVVGACLLRTLYVLFKFTVFHPFSGRLLLVENTIPGGRL
jgi:hypothetical protein